MSVAKQVPALLNGISNRLVEIAINVNLHLVFPGRPVLRHGQMAMDDILRASGGVVDIFDVLVLCTAGIHDPPRKLHLRP